MLDDTYWVMDMQMVQVTEWDVKITIGECFVSCIVYWWQKFEWNLSARQQRNHNEQ